MKQDLAAKLRVQSLPHVQAYDDDHDPEREKATNDQQGHEQASQFSGVLNDRYISSTHIIFQRSIAAIIQ